MRAQWPKIPSDLRTSSTEGTQSTLLALWPKRSTEFPSALPWRAWFIPTQHRAPLIYKRSTFIVDRRGHTVRPAPVDHEGRPLHQLVQHRRRSTTKVDRYTLSRLGLVRGVQRQAEAGVARRGAVGDRVSRTVRFEGP